MVIMAVYKPSLTYRFISRQPAIFKEWIMKTNLQARRAPRMPVEQETKKVPARWQLTLLPAILACGVFAGVDAQAGTVVGTWVGTDPAGATVTRSIVSGPAAPQINSDQTAERFDLVRTGGTDTHQLVGSGVFNHFYAFCIEPRQFITPNLSIQYDFVPVATAPTNLGGMGAPKADQITELFGRYAPNLAAPMTTQQAGALQIAIWEIVRELPGNPLDVYNDNIYFGSGENPAGMIALAQSYVQSLDGTGPRAQGLFSIINGIYGDPSTDAGTQDLLVQAVPEPSSLALAGLAGCLALGSYLRRRRGSGQRSPVATQGA